MSPIEHLLATHDMQLVLLAAAVCLLGCWATSRFFPRVVATRGAQRIGWVVLTGLTAGVSVWCTHFIAMLAHSSSDAVRLDEPLTVLSLVIAILGIGLGVTIAAARPSRTGAVLGGLVVGAAIAGLHYSGMAAYRTEGEVVWDLSLVALSIVFSLLAPAAAMLVARRGDTVGRNGQWLLLAVAIVLLHFTGMSAFTVGGAHHHDHGTGTAPDLQMLVVFIAALGFVVVASGVAGYLIDDRGRAERDEQLRALAALDTLTMLPNRTGFTALLDQELAAAREHGHRLALLGIDLHGFASINDRRGRSVGDEALRAVGRRLASLAEDRDDVVVARVGGDEFAVLVRSAGGLDDLLAELERALSSEAALEAGGAERLPGAAIGVAVYPDDARGAEELVAGADLALQRSKADPQQRPRFYDRLEDQRTRTRRGLAADLQGAHERDELRLRFRPQARLRDRRTVGYAAIVHWEHPSLGPVLQHDLLPLAQEHGTATAIADWTLRAACREALGWDPALRLAVTVPAQLLDRHDLAAQVRGALEASGLAPQRLELVLAGTAQAADAERALASLRELAALGVLIALDGPASSSLALLRAFAVDRITVDGSMLRASGAEAPSQPSTEADADARARELVRAVAGLGRALGTRVLAEGVAHESQLELLLAAGVDEAQGALLGRPMPAERLAAPVG